MRKIILSAALVFMIGGAEALAQGSSSVSKNPSIPQAPIGHRQPRPSDLPPNQKDMVDPNDPLAKENAALDRKIKSICRGC